MTSDSPAATGAESFDDLPPAAQVLSLQAQLGELRRENNQLRLDLEAATAQQADAAELRRKYQALRNSTLGRVTHRYWDMRSRFRRAN